MKAKPNEEFKKSIEETKVEDELLKELIERVDPNFVLQSINAGVGHAKA